MEDKRKSKIANSILVAIIVAIITSVINYFIWQIQFSTTKDNELQKARIETFEKFTSSFLKYHYLKPFRIRMILKQMIIIEEEAISTQTKPNIENSIKAIGEIEKKFPFEYGKMLECDEFSPAFRGTLMLARTYFDEPVRGSILKLENVMDEQKLFDRFSKEKKISGFKEINEDYFLSYYDSLATKEYEIIINSMYSKLK